MPNKLIFIGSLLLVLAGCATTSPHALSVAPDVRSTSQADDILFQDMLGAIGGVGFADRVYYPDAKHREVVRIEVITPYGSGRPGSERWYIQHDGKDVVTYLITFTPDGKGGTYFSTKMEKPEAQSSRQ